MNKIFRYPLVSCGMLSGLCAQEDPTYTNFIRQVQLTNPNVISYLNGIDPNGANPSPMALQKGGARFELWTVRSNPFNSFLLQSTYANAVMATVVIDTEDPWGKDLESVPFANPNFATDKIVPKNAPAAVRRTRADRPFKVYVFASGLTEGNASVADVEKKLNFLRHTQSYGATGTGDGINRDQAILATPAQPQVIKNGYQNPLVVSVSGIAGADRRKLRGEETFSVWTLEDNTDPSKPMPAQKLSSDYLQIWPMSSGSLAGLVTDQVVRFSMPTVTFNYIDTYPGSQTFAQIYKGEMRNNVDGQIVPGSHRNNTSMVPENNLEVTGTDFDRMFDSDGRWTLEILTVSPFDTIRLAHVSFYVDRTLELNGNLSTIGAQ